MGAVLGFTVLLIIFLVGVLLNQREKEILKSKPTQKTLGWIWNVNETFRGRDIAYYRYIVGDKVYCDSRKFSGQKPLQEFFYIIEYSLDDPNISRLDFDNVISLDSTIYYARKHGISDIDIINDPKHYENCD